MKSPSKGLIVKFKLIKLVRHFTICLVISELKGTKFERKGTLCRTNYFIIVHINIF